MRWFAVLALASCLAAASPLNKQVDAVLASSPAARKAHWGIYVVDLATGRPVYQRNHDSLFVPASNAKLFSTSLALSKLGPDHRFRTTVTAAQAPDSTGRIQGDVSIIGGGDPTLSGRVVPYQKGAKPGDALAAIQSLADQVVARGVTRIEGDIVGDDTAYLWEPYPDGWSRDDTVWDYGAPVSALSVNDNALTLTVRPAPRTGEPARISINPAFEYYHIDNRTKTEERPGGKVRIERLPGSRTLQVWGSVSPRGSGVSFLLAIDDPALYAAAAFHDAITSRGVAVAGRPVAKHRFPNEPDPAPAPSAGRVELASRTSPPLVEILQIINKVSQNLHAEIVLREVGRVRRASGSREAGLEELKAFLREAGVPSGEFQFEDGSGLSRLTLVTPQAVTTLLAHMEHSPHAAAWRDLLPVGGADGTLSSRFESDSAAVRIRGKTGSLSHVSALSGYFETGGRRLAFSIMVNNYNTPSSEVRRLIDKISLLFTR